MEIIVDHQEERLLIESLCDVALRAGGVKNLKETTIILAAIKNRKPEKKGKKE